MIAVQGTDSQSFRMAVSHAFQHVLGGRAWEPLRAEICHAQKLEGFPMLQRLDPEQKREDYNMMFLQERCAVCDASGRISSMYVAPSEGIISWDDIRRLPVFVEGLEASWEHDKYLDDQDSDTSEEQELELELVYGSKADDLAASPTRALKRGTAMMSQSNVLATGGVPTSEFEGPRAKMARTRMTGVVGV